jgi:hypothetical protein
MSGPDALQNEMPGFPFPGRPGGAHDEPLLDVIFNRCPLPPGAPQEMHDLARMLAAADGPGDPSELAGEAAALAAFSRFASPAGVWPTVPGRAVPRPAVPGHTVPGPAARWRPQPARSRRGRRGRRGHYGGRVRVRLATALAVTVAALASAAAAYIGVLPGPLQRVAHVTVGAPAPAMHGSPAREHRRPGHGRPHREAPRLGTVPTHRKAGATRTSQARPRRTRGPGAPGCRPWPYQLPPGWAPPDPAWAPVPRQARCPGSGARAVPAATATRPPGPTSASPGTHVYTSGGGSPAQQAKPSPAPTAGSYPGPRTSPGE